MKSKLFFLIFLFQFFFSNESEEKQEETSIEIEIEIFQDQLNRLIETENFLVRRFNEANALNSQNDYYFEDKYYLTTKQDYNIYYNLMLKRKAAIHSEEEIKMKVVTSYLTEKLDNSFIDE